MPIKTAKPDTSAQNPQQQPGQNPPFIEPGQFVVAGVDIQQASTNPAQQQPPPAQQEAQNQQTPDLNEAVSQAVQEENPQNQTAQPTPKPVMHLAQERSEVVNEPVIAGSPGIDLPSPATGQPDPTLFSPNASANPAETPHELIHGNQKSGSFKKIIIFIGVLILIGILSALAYFIIVKKGSFPLSANIISQPPAQIEEPPPLPKRTTGGFSSLPSMTTPGATESATPSGLLMPQP